MIVLTLVEKVVLNAQISKRPPSFKLFTEANERNAEAEKRQNKIGIIISPSENKKCIEINKLKQLKNWNLPIVMLASLFSVQTEPDTVTCMLLPQKCSHLQVNTGCSTVLLKMLLSGMRLAINTAEVTFSILCSPQGFFDCSLVSCR